MREIKFNDCIEGYDRSLFYKNDLSIDGADPGALYVTEEMSKEWGGYFYVYVTGERVNQETGEKYAYVCYRTKDLSNWERIGQVEGGCSLYVRADDWAEKWFWAPEVTFNPKDRKFYMYFSASSHLAGENTEYTANSEDRWSGLYLGIAVSDTPAGPFVMAESKDCEGGVNLNGDVISRFNPPFNFEKKMNIGHTWAAIDISPYFAPDGNFYVYFAKHVDAFHSGLCVWGMKMKDMITPDYSTLTQLTQQSVKCITNTPGNYEKVFEGEGEIREGSVNEGPFMTYHNGLYYLTYSPFGFGSREYSIMQAVSQNPLGPFDKVPREIGNPSLGINDTNDYMAGTGHHNFAYADGEIIAVYHAHRNPVCPHDEQGRFLGRVVCVDKMHFVYNEQLGYDILLGNGPTASVQPNARVSAEYVNLAGKATVKSNAISGEKYLTDDVFTTQKFDWDKEATFDGEARVTLSFDSPITVKAVMVYNSAKYDNAFSKVDEITFTTESGEKLVAKDVKCNPANVDTEKRFMRQGGSAIAVVEPISVVSIDIKISEKYEDSVKELAISDIAVLAK